MLNKRGADLITVIIWLVAGLIVAALLIWGFATNWQVFSSFTGGNNVNAIVTQCQTACATADSYGFCTLQRTLKAPDLPDKQATSTCQDFAKNPIYQTYKITQCPSLCS